VDWACFVEKNVAQVGAEICCNLVRPDDLNLPEEKKLYIFRCLRFVYAITTVPSTASSSSLSTPVLASPRRHLLLHHSYLCADAPPLEAVLSVKTHRRAATSNTRSRRLPRLLTGPDPSVNGPRSGTRPAV
jgi:hypothetical protein